MTTLTLTAYPTDDSASSVTWTAEESVVTDSYLDGKLTEHSAFRIIVEDMRFKVGHLDRILFTYEINQ